VRQPPPAAPTTTAESPAAPPSTQVLVAAVDIPVGTTISESSIEWRDWPDSGLSDRFVQFQAGADQKAELVGAIARASLYAGEPVTDGKLIRTDQGYMAAILPPGMRAIAIGISVVTTAGGFILPNDRVDVIMVRPSDSEGSDFVTETILSNIRVLAIDQAIEDNDGEKTVVGTTATLELTPRQAQILAAAQPVAERLMLSLRSIADSNAAPADQDLDAVHLIDGSKRDGVVTVVKSGVAQDVTGVR
jgi:pilus assembly protein CpaB